MVRQPLKPALCQAISCILIDEVHKRDIIQNLIKQEVVDFFKCIYVCIIGKMKLLLLES